MLTDIQTRILSAFSREVQVDDGSSAAVEGPLKILEWSYPNLREMIAGKTILDFGCGYGDQAAAMVRKYGAIVTGVDSDDGYLAEGIRRYSGECELLKAVPPGRKWDVVTSINCMEHYPDPGAALDQMLEAVKPGGKILMTFGPLWWAPWGSHMNFFCQIPWLQLWFSEKAIMAVRSKYRNDGAVRFEECREGLNRMSVRKFERLMQLKRSSAKSISVRLSAVKRIQFLTHIPVLRELFTSHIIAELDR